MKVLTIFGTRPEIIRLSLIMKILDQHCEHITVHTGQNFDRQLSDVFFEDLKLRQPDEHLQIRSKTFGEQVGSILSETDKILGKHQPDKIVILGDTNSALSAIVAARRGIPVYHLEAGNRCYDNRVPEEINRRVIDHSSTFLLPYTERSKENLVREGIERERIFVTGNPIKEVLDSIAAESEARTILEDLAVESFQYFLITLHRAENVDLPERLEEIFRAFDLIQKSYDKKILISTHPRTAEKLRLFGIEPQNEQIKLLEPLGFLDFVKLEKNALAILSDSGTVQEECAIFGIPNVTLRDVTERPETIECGSNILTGGKSEQIINALRLAISQPADWTAPKEYMTDNVSQIVSKIVLGHLDIRKYGCV